MAGRKVLGNCLGNKERNIWTVWVQAGWRPSLKSTEDRWLLEVVLCGTSDCVPINWFLHTNLHQNDCWQVPVLYGRAAVFVVWRYHNSTVTSTVLVPWNEVLQFHGSTVLPPNTTLEKHDCQCWRVLHGKHRKIKKKNKKIRLNDRTTFCDNTISIYTVSQKNIPDIFSYNSRKHWRIFIIFGRNVTEKASNHMLLYFSNSPN